MLIAIYSNTGEWGGVDVIIMRLSAYLTSREYPHCIIEPEGSRLRLELPSALFVSPDDVQSVSNLVTHVVAPTVSNLRDSKFPWRDLQHAKILVWVVHPNDVFWGFFPFSGLLMRLFGYRAATLLKRTFSCHTKLYFSFFRKLVDCGALVVMDGATRRTLNYFIPVLSSEPVIVPIPAPLTEIVGRHEVRTQLAIGYLGRMDRMKWSAMKPFVLNVLAPLTKERSVALHVVAEGSHLTMLQKLCERNGIEFHSYGYQPNNHARRIMVTHTDVAVAMGTSALDLAGSGHPCIVLDPGLWLFTRYQKRFRFIHETDDFTLGEYRDFPGYVRGRAAFSELISDHELTAASSLGRSYVKNAHDPAQCFDTLLSCINSSTLVVGELFNKFRLLEASSSNLKNHPILLALRLRAIFRWKRAADVNVLGEIGKN